MGRKRNPVLPIFTRDILSSPRCRALSELAAGIYFFLLCRLNEPPQPGAYRLSDWELHPNWRRSKTQQCLATADKYERLPYFAAMLAKNDLPWRQKNILAGLQELYKYGIITIEGDMLVQPRMYKDNGFRLPDIDQDGDPEGTILDDPASGQMTTLEGDEIRSKKGVRKADEKSAEISTEKSTEKVHEKVQVSHAHAPVNRDRDRAYNNNNSNIGGVGENAHGAENGANNPGDDPTGFWAFWHLYDKKRIGNRWIAIDSVQQQWETLSGDERTAAMDFTDGYVKATPVKKYRMHPVRFLQDRAWQTLRIDGGRVVADGAENTEIVPESDANPVQKPQNSAAKPKTARKPAVSDNPPTLEEVQAYFDEMATKGKPFQYVTPETFFDACEQSGWRLKDGKPMVSWQARVRTFENFRREHGDRPVGSPPPIRSPQQGRTVDQSQTMTVDEDNFAGQEKW